MGCIEGRMDNVERAEGEWGAITPRQTIMGVHCTYSPYVDSTCTRNLPPTPVDPTSPHGPRMELARLPVCSDGIHHGEEGQARRGGQEAAVQ